MLKNLRLRTLHLLRRRFGIKVHSGTSRIAFVGPRYTIKLSKLHLRTAIKKTAYVIRHEKLDLSQKISFFILPNRIKGTYVHSLRKILFSGIRSNINEMRTSRSLKTLVAPTVFSLLGIMNIQSTARPLRSNTRDFKYPVFTLVDWFYEKINAKLVKDCAHVFASSRNFGMLDGKFVLIDYGDKSVTKMIDRDHLATKEIFEKARLKKLFITRISGTN